MDTKLEPSASVKVRRRRYLAELKEELGKVSWTSKEELIFSSKVVVWATFLFGMGIYLIDLMIKGVLHSVGYLLHLIGF